MCRVECPCCGHISAPVSENQHRIRTTLSFWIRGCQTILKHEDGFSTTPLPVFLNCSPWLSVVWWATCTVLRTARCTGVPHSVPEHNNQLPSRRKPWTNQPTAAMSVWTGSADTRCTNSENSKVGKHEVCHASQEKRLWSNCVENSTGCKEGALHAKKH